MIHATVRRIDHDPLGPVELDADCLHGPQAERARSNFDLSRTRVSDLPELIVALAEVKKAAALTHRETGGLSPEVAGAVVGACDELIGGAHHAAFDLDVCQGGAGTSTNMAANEIIANVALLRLGLTPGAYDVIHPNDHVNRGQSTNDVYATAIRLAAYRQAQALAAALDRLAEAFAAKVEAFSRVPKLGRTQLQDAVPMTLGQEFAAFAAVTRDDAARLRQMSAELLTVNLGGTAIGTGLGAEPAYRARVTARLAEVTGLPVRAADDLIAATSDTGVFVLYSGMLKRVAAKMSKIASDLRLLSSGPCGGMGEIHLPKRQPGSSIMPGKVNPVIPEAINCLAFRVFGCDAAVTFAAEAGQLQLNAFEPVIIWSLHEAATLLTRGADALRLHCVDGIVADSVRCGRNLAQSTALAAELVPHLGYARAAEIAQHAQESGDLIASVRLLAPEWSEFIAQKASADFALAHP
jgi:aspartate ammonia-lyase